jgi:hypothetical protein
MNHEKIFVRPDGSRVKVIVRFSMPGPGPTYRFRVERCFPKKRTFKDVVDESDWKYRTMEFEERKADILRQQLLFVSEEELLAVKLELWEKLKPT